MTEDLPATIDEDEPQRSVVPFNPALLGFPPLLPVELALAEQKPAEICKAYDISREDFKRIVENPVFVKAYQDAVKMLQQEGMSYRIKARMQAEALLETSWALIHSNFTPANVKADLIKHTAKVAGLEPKEGAAVAVPLSININLG